MEERENEKRETRNRKSVLGYPHAHAQGITVDTPTQNCGEDPLVKITQCPAYHTLS